MSFPPAPWQPVRVEIPPRFNVLGVGVHALHLTHARDLVLTAARATDGVPRTVCCCDVNSVSCARRDAAHRRFLNRSFLTTPDGMPLVWLGRRAGHRTIDRVYGPDLLEAVGAATAGTALAHFFCGGGHGTAERLAARLSARFPGLRIAGTITPPFGPIDESRARELVAHIRTARPHFVWLGLSTPKQEAFMARFAPLLGVPVLLGVGAAFDFLSGRVRQAPRWVQRSGTEWLWRLASEPQRLGPRYLRNNPLFVLRAGAQLSGLRHYTLD
ncbi:MAG TPA: WecB/TagA/CpsF family glycosyltransferase [Opitutaceae bacterium]